MENSPDSTEVAFGDATVRSGLLSLRRFIVSFHHSCSPPAGGRTATPGGTRASRGRQELVNYTPGPRTVLQTATPRALVPPLRVTWSVSSCNDRQAHDPAIHLVPPVDAFTIAASRHSGFAVMKASTSFLMTSTWGKQHTRSRKPEKEG